METLPLKEFLLNFGEWSISLWFEESIELLLLNLIKTSLNFKYLKKYQSITSLLEWLVAFAILMSLILLQKSDLKNSWESGNKRPRLAT